MLLMAHTRFAIEWFVPFFFLTRQVSSTCNEWMDEGMMIEQELTSWKEEDLLGKKVKGGIESTIENWGFFLFVFSIHHDINVLN